MTRSAVIELTLRRRDYYRSSVDLRYTAPEADTEDYCTGEARFNISELRDKSLDDKAYGQVLTDSIFGHEDIRRRFDEAFQATAGQGLPLRIRLLIGSSALDLQTLRWERLHRPGTDHPLLTQEFVHFSRFMTSHDWRPVRLRAKSKLRALALIANPSDLEEKYGLEPVDAAFEQDLLNPSLPRGCLKLLSEAGDATYRNLLDELSTGYDILYLVCHGQLGKNGRPYLYLENSQGLVHRTDGLDLANKIEGLEFRPRLVMLVSCDSAGKVSDVENVRATAHPALGPVLAEAGVPAILAFHGKIAMETAKEFVPCFFENLLTDGQIDQAVAVARWKISTHHDWWKPVLYSRLRSGRLWYTSGLAPGDPKGGLKQWNDLLSSIKNKKCTPILGPGATEYILGSRREVTRQWAEDEHFPLAARDRGNLEMVCQYLQTKESDSFMRDRLLAYLREQLVLKHKDDLPPDADTVAKMVDAVGRKRIKEDPNEPHRVLASLDLPVYVTANFGDVLSTALTVQSGEKKKPIVELLRWREEHEVEWPESHIKQDPDWQPSPEQPLVFHLFGHLKYPDTVVLSEDDYFDYLIGMDADKKHIPERVGSALANTALLFLGFRVDDWSFRVLYRSISKQKGRAARRRFRHVAVQIDPEDWDALDPAGARDFLEEYFVENRIALYWGNVQDFVDDLKEKWNE